MTIKNHAKVCLMVSAAIMIVALLMSIFGAGINLGIDFAGGLSMEYSIAPGYDSAVVEKVLDEMNVGSYTLTVQGADKGEAVIRIRDVAEDDIQKMQSTFETGVKETYPEMYQSGDVNYVGPVAGATLLSNAFWSVMIASVLMLVYIAFRFDLNSGLSAVFGLIHDVLMMLAFMVLLRSFIQMNSSFIAAMLTIVGYSINNTIVIFDRIRENTKKLPGSTTPVEVVNRSVKECLGRTINTTLTTLLTIVSLYVLGVNSIKEFALPIIIGIVSGVYSANMINGYVWAFLESKKRNQKVKKA